MAGEMNDDSVKRRLSPEEHLRSVRDLWKECFGDSDEFLDIYFSRVYSPQVDYSVELDARVVSALQCIPYNMLCGGSECSTAYLSGVCTAREYRRRGLAGRLVEQATRDMRSRGCVFGFLIPSGRNVLPFYRAYGYYLAMRRKAVLLPHRPDSGADVSYRAERVTAFSDELYELFVKRQRERAGYALLHGREQFSTVVTDWLKGGNLIIAARCAGKMMSYLFARPDEGCRTLFVYDAPASEEPVFGFLAEQVRGMYGGFSVKSYAVGRSAREMFACARIVDAERALGIYALLHPEASMNVRIYGDRQIEDNNGCFAVSGGKCMRAADTGRCCVPMTMAALTRMIFSSDDVSFNFLLE